MKLEGYSNYEIYPETGQVFSYTSKKYLKFDTCARGNRCKCTLINDENKKIKWFVHRLIWTVVNGEIPEGMQINHNDENTQNNSISNLSLMTAKENCNWGTRNKRISLKLTNGKNSKPIVGIKNDKLFYYFPSSAEAQRNGFQQAHINKCCNKETFYKTHKGYKWQYMDDYLADWWEQEMEKAA